MLRVKKIVDSFPKKRLQLSENYLRVLDKEYSLNRTGKLGLVNRLSVLLESWMHRKIAKVPKSGSVLEIGAGTLNHLGYESLWPLTTYDIVEPYKKIFSESPLLSKVSSVYGEISEIPGDKKYDTILSIATYEHVESLPSLLCKSCELLKSDGKMLIGIPSEGGFLWGLSWRLTTGITFYLRNKLSYAQVMRYEHINDQAEIGTLIKFLFKTVKVARFPLGLKHLSFYTYFEASDVSIEALNQMKAWINYDKK